MRQIAENGGCVGIMFLTFTLHHSDNSSEVALKHFKNAINICGEDHVGVGSDGPYISPPYEQIICHSKMLGEKLDKDGKMGSRAPHHPLELYHPYKLHVIERMLYGEFGSRIAEKIIGLNWKRYLDEFFPE
jgi:membrane dipeptidase